jgi:putative ABC transport system permease protein
VWSRVRHRRLQALSLVALAALLTTSLCLGPLYQRAMEQALAGSVLDAARPVERALTLSSADLSASELEAELPAGLQPHAGRPVHSTSVSVSVPLPDGGNATTRLYAFDDACARLKVVDGACPRAGGEVMVSTADVAVNGWTLGDRVKVLEQFKPDVVGDSAAKGPVTIIGVYAPPQDRTWLGAPLLDRAGQSRQDEGVLTDDWVVARPTLSGRAASAGWHAVDETVSWPMDDLDVDALVRLGPAVAALRRASLERNGPVRVDSVLPTLAERVVTGRQQGRTTVVVLVAQLLVLVAVVLWMVLVAATDDRRAELALARLRGRGRRGAAAYLLSELLPLTLGGVGLGILAAPLFMAAVAKAVFPVSVPVELPGGFLLAALGSAAAVLVVVLTAARRAVREPVDSLLRAVPARHTDSGAGIVEIALVVFSLTAVVALLTGNLEGPLATLAPTLLAVATGLLLARALAPVTRWVSRRLLRSGRAAAAAGIVNAVRRPAARRILVMVVVASALFVFCADALVTGKHNRQNAAEQLNGAPYSLTIQATDLDDVVAAVAAADPDQQHLTPVASTTQVGTTEGTTVAVDTTVFSKVAYVAAGDAGPADWAAIAPPSDDPLLVRGTTFTGIVASDEVSLTGPSRDRIDEFKIGLQLLGPDGATGTSYLSVVPQRDESAAFSAAVPCPDGCTVTGIAVITPPGGEALGTITLRDLTVDGQPFSLGPATAWRRVQSSGGSTIPTSDADGDLGVIINGSGSAPPVMVSAWVPEPVRALVTSPEDARFSADGLDGIVDMLVAGNLSRVPGSPPGSRVVDLVGLLRRPHGATSNVRLAVWSDDADALTRVRAELKKRGVTVAEETTVDEVRAELDASPAAWSLALSVLVGGAALLVAMLVMIVATATTWRARATDLAALRMAGLSSRSLRRMELLGQLPVVLVGALAGAVSGTAAAVFALPGVRQFTDPPDIDTTDFSTPWVAVLAAAAVAVVLLTALGMTTARWTARRAPFNRIREVV